MVVVVAALRGLQDPLTQNHGGLPPRAPPPKNLLALTESHHHAGVCGDGERVRGGSLHGDLSINGHNLGS